MEIREPDHICEYRDVLRRFVENEMPREAAAEWNRTDTYPKEVVDKLADLGVMGLTIPEEYGGMGIVALILRGYTIMFASFVFVFVVPLLTYGAYLVYRGRSDRK